MDRTEMEREMEAETRAYLAFMAAQMKEDLAMLGITPVEPVAAEEPEKPEKPEKPEDEDHELERLRYEERRCEAAVAHDAWMEDY